MSVFIFVLSFCGIYYLSSVIYPETFKGGEGYIGTFISLATYKEGEEKILVDACYLIKGKTFRGERRTAAVTDKTIDLANRGIWLTDGQCKLGIIMLVSGVLAVIIYLLTGLGTLFELTRPYCAIGFDLLFAFPPFGAAIVVVEVLAVSLIGFLLPVYLTVELVLGIIQTLNEKRLTESVG